MKKSFKATNIAISLGLLATLVGCDVGSEKAARPLDRFVKPLVWAACEGKEAPEAPFECATMKAPLDYKNIKGETIDIAMIRIPASEGKSKGAILMNPGGPGQSGFDALAYAGEYDRSKMGLHEYDYVSFDPRGVDRSGGLRCHTDKELDQTLMVDWTPDDEAEKNALEVLYKLGDPCEKKFGDSLKFFSTENTARDMDLMRESMGLKKINYLGFSYGTYLGGVYVTLFPDNVESMVLDSAFDPVGDTDEESLLTQRIGFNDSYDRFAEWCNDNIECAFTTSDFNADWLALEKELDEKSIVTKSGRFVNAETLDTATTQAFYGDESLRPVLAKALHDARNGKGAGLLKLADEYNGRDDNGRYSTSSDSFGIIQCASGIVDKGAKNPAKMLKLAKKKAPWSYRHAEKSWFESSSCGEKYDGVKPIAISYSGNASIVVIGGDKDPATPFRWAKKMNKSMKGSVLVKYTLEGHASVGTNHCTSKVAANVLVNRKLPSVGKECGIDLPLPEPNWWAAAVKGVGGTAVDAELGNYYFSMEPADTFAQYRAIAGSTASVFRSVSQQLTKNGFPFYGSNDLDPTKGSQWFQSSTDETAIIRVWLESPSALAENGMHQPDGQLPKGTALVMLYFIPMEE